MRHALTRLPRTKSGVADLSRRAGEVIAGKLLRSLPLALLLAAALPASANTLDRVRGSGTLTCGAEPRPGFAEAAEGGVTGAAVEFCRAIALAVLGPSGQVRFHLHQAPKDFQPIRSGAEDVAFLTGGAIAERDLSAAILPGPVVFIDPVTVMVPAASPIHTVSALAGKTLCVLTGSLGQRALMDAAERLGFRFSPMAFQEESEMADAYRAGRCDAIAGLATELAALRGPDAAAGRLLDPPLGIEPVIAATGATDGRWAALVAWVMDALILADAPSGGWQAPGAAALPVRARPPGLRPHWREEITSRLGGYGAIIRRTVTARTALPAGPNAPWPRGLLVVPSVH